MKRVGGLIFPGFELLDLFGPFEMFGIVEDELSLTLVAEEAGLVASAQKIEAQASWGFDDAPHLDILFVPGGMGTRKLAHDAKTLDWIAARSEAAELTLSVCTGALLLGKAHVLDGRRATTNKAAFDKIAAQVPGVDWVRQARWVEDGDVVTSSGVSAGMDMSLRVIEMLLGSERAETAARLAEYEWHRDPDWDPFAEIYE
jgi:transcriptional regulator GlxA family with amidase domain